MTAEEILEKLKLLGQDGYKKTLLNHGVVEPVFGVKIEELKKIQKVVKRNYQLALDLYDTGVYDAMYLAGLVADDNAMTKPDLQHWVSHAKSEPISLYTVPWVAAQGLHGWELGLEWIESPQPSVAASGWATLSGLVALADDENLDIDALRSLLLRIPTLLPQQPRQVSSAMNSFVIAIGSYVSALTQPALDMSEQTELLTKASDAIRKIEQRGGIGKKRKTIKC